MTPAAGIYGRAISPNERLYFAGARLAPPFAIQIVVEGTGRIELETLRRAVALASEACPGARLVARGGRWLDSGGAPPVREVAWTTDAPFESAAFLRDPLDASVGPTCEVLLVSREPQTLVFRAFHGVMDGKGALTWVREIFRALRGEPLVGARSSETDIGLVRRLGAKGRRAPVRFSHRSPLAASGLDDARFLWKRRAIRGAHAGLVAKTAAILAERSDDERLCFMVPVDLRRHDASLSSTANLSLPILLDVARGEAWEELHARLIARLGERAELALDGAEAAVGVMPLWGLAGAVRMALRKQRRGGLYFASGILSHLGRVDARDFSAPGFTAGPIYSLPVHAPLAPLSLTAIEHGETTELALSFPEGEGMEARATALLDAIEEGLGRNDMRRWSGNQTSAPYRSDETIAQLFAAQVKRTPSDVALVRGSVTVSYAELGRRSRQIARALASRGIGPGAIIGLVADRTEDAIAALLGVLVAGAAYLPIDPNYPDDRIRYMLADAGVRHCLVQASLAPRLASSRFEGEAIALEAITADAGAADGPEPIRPAGPSDLAYVIYTSGSTGKPKGVEIEHRHLVNYVDWATREYGVDRTTRFALFTSLSFDLSITSLFVPLLAGGSVALFPEELDHVTLRRVLDGSGVNALKLTPTHLDLISRLGLSPRGFRAIVVGGEQLRGAVAARAHEVFGADCRIVNEYGPTETTVGCVTYAFEPARDAAVAAVPIGVPASNVRVYVLDRQRHAVERGEIGELYIAGDGVARGYLGRAELTAERFVTLFDAERAYRTGDLARLGADGQLEFVGRTDGQIKVRGHRIEPGEIEAVLEQHPCVERAVVLGRARAGDANEKVLCAYVVPRVGLDDDELRTFLAARLPRALVPTFVVRVPEVPLTTNGKVDVRALPDPLAVAGDGGARAQAPEGSEGDVARIWSAILGVDVAMLAPEADFHRLGGDSLQMVQMLSTVATRIVGAAGEGAFMRDAHAIIRHPTLEAVQRAAERSRHEGRQTA